MSQCEQASIGDVTLGRGPNGDFDFVVALEEPASQRVECGGAYEVYVTPGDRLKVTLREDKSVEFSGTGAAANRYLGENAILSMASFVELAPMEHGAFVENWRSLHVQSLERVARVEQDGADPAFVERERVRLHFVWATGRVLAPYFRWRDSDAADIVPDPELPAIVSQLPTENSRWWSLTEHQAFLGAYIHTVARERLATDPALRTGDNRWLRAELGVAESWLASPQLELRESTRLVATHVDENGSRGIDAIVERWRATNPEPTAVVRLDEAIAADRAQREGHAIGVYRHVDGVPLEVHVLEPLNETKPGLRPAMLWLHGGSFSEGIWWHSPVLTTALRNLGVVVVAVEMRTASRFDTGPVEQIADASEAYRWVQTHASDHNIDPARIGVAGFSSGATVALILATRGLERSSDVSRLNPPERPAAIVVMGACANPLSERSDGWFRKSVSRAGNDAASAYSPAELIGPGLPRLLGIHGTRDEYCEYGDMKAFVERSRAYGNDSELETVVDASHFFGFYDQAGQAQTREALRNAIERWGWAE